MKIPPESKREKMSMQETDIKKRYYPIKNNGKDSF